MTKIDREKVLAMFDGKCAYCGRTLTRERKGDLAFQVEHVKAKYLGGDNSEANLLPACRMCNYYKQTLTTEQLREQLGTLLGRLEKVFIFRLAVAYGLIQVTPHKITFHKEKHNDHP